MTHPIRSVVLALLFLAPLTTLHGADEPKKPNIAFILADDLGWSDTTLFATTQFCQTPNLERLATRGMLVTRAYLPAGKDEVQVDWIELKPAKSRFQRRNF